MSVGYRIGIMGALLPAIFAFLPANANEGIHPDAPKETAQYAFIVGVWDCSTKSMRPDGSFVTGKATWEGAFILSGWAIQDFWTSHKADGSPAFFGTNIRSFDPKLKKWHCRWVASGNLVWKDFISWKDGDTMIMEGTGRDQRGDFVDRNTFYDIGKDRWSWRKDRSYDGGTTWIQGVAHIEAHRRK